MGNLVGKQEGAESCLTCIGTLYIKQAMAEQNLSDQ